MTRHYYSRLFYSLGLVIVLTVLNGCALLSGLTTPDNKLTEDDPVAREASRIRNESSTLGTLSQEETRDQEERQYRRQQEVQSALESGEIIVGMDMNQVMSIWGRPRDVETAGEVRTGNQRWTYHDGISGRWNINPTRIVYFEEGKVVGWEMSH